MRTIDMTKKLVEQNEDAEIYAQREYEKDLAHSDVLICYQTMLTEKLGYLVTLGDAEDVAYGWGGTRESRTERIRRKYTLENNEGSEGTDLNAVQQHASPSE
jgi:hypothetical protein